MLSSLPFLSRAHLPVEVPHQHPVRGPLREVQVSRHDPGFVSGVACYPHAPNPDDRTVAFSFLMIEGTLWLRLPEGPHAQRDFPLHADRTGVVCGCLGNEHTARSCIDARALVHALGKALATIAPARERTIHYAGRVEVKDGEIPRFSTVRLDDTLRWVIRPDGWSVVRRDRALYSCMVCVSAGCACRAIAAGYEPIDGAISDVFSPSDPAHLTWSLSPDAAGTRALRTAGLTCADIPGATLRLREDGEAVLLVSSWAGAPDLAPSSSAGDVVAQTPNWIRGPFSGYDGPHLDRAYLAPLMTALFPTR